MAKSIVEMPIIGLSTIDLGPAELRDVPLDIASAKPQAAMLASLEYAFGQALKRATLNGVGKSELTALLEGAMKKIK